MNNTGKNKKFRIKFVSTLTIFSLISVLLITTVPVSACHYTVGTFEDDYTTSKEEFLIGETVYGRGNAYGYYYLLKLRIKDPDGDIVYYSDESKYVVYGSYFLNETAKTGTWYIQLGIYNNGWQWSNNSGRISSFTVEDVSYTLSINIVEEGFGIVEVDLKGEYHYGDVVNLIAIPNDGNSFNFWSGDLNGSDNPESIFMDSNKTVTVHFSQSKYILTINIDGNGYVLKDPDQENYTFGTLLNLTAIADSGWEFDYWSENLSGENISEEFIITEHITVTAHFKKSESNGGNNNGGGSKGNSGGSSSSSSSNKDPVANAGGPYYGLPEELIEFDGSKSYDINSDIVSYIWEFGDETTGIGKIVKHNFSVIGDYSVSLKLIDAHGASDIDKTIAIIAQPNHPPSDPNIAGPPWGFTDDEYDFSIVSSDDDNDNIRYIIDWGDGTQTVSDFILSGEAFNIMHSWNKSGIFTINVTADDNETVSNNNITITIDDHGDPDIPEENNICLILLLILLILLILFLLLADRKKRKKNKKGKKSKKGKKNKK